LPFGRRARVRFESAGMAWHYDVVYAVASDYAHVNARAVMEYLREPGQKEEEPGSGRVAKLSMACEFLMRSLYFADQALFQDKRDFLDAYAAE
jgi:hypothetical protein